MRAGKRCGERGTSISEMLAVVAVLSVIGGLGALSLRKRSQQVDAAGIAQELFARAAEARLLAVTSGCQAVLALDPLDADRDGLVATVRLATSPGMAPVPLVFGPPADGVSYRRDAGIVAIAAGTTLSGPFPTGAVGPDALVFYPDSSVRLQSATGVQGATIYMRDRNALHPYRVVIFGRTGFAKVLDR